MNALSRWCSLCRVDSACSSLIALRNISTASTGEIGSRSLISHHQQAGVGPLQTEKTDCLRPFRGVSGTSGKGGLTDSNVSGACTADFCVSGFDAILVLLQGTTRSRPPPGLLQSTKTTSQRNVWFSTEKTYRKKLTITKYLIPLL